jgi:hypothetical protein
VLALYCRFHVGSAPEDSEPDIVLNLNVTRGDPAIEGWLQHNIGRVSLEGIGSLNPTDNRARFTVASRALQVFGEALSSNVHASWVSMRIFRPS